MPVSIYPVTKIEQCRIIEDLQRTVWGSHDIEVVPDHLILTMAKEGGVVLLAEDEAGRYVGFAYGFLGQTEAGEVKLASHQVGVLPAYQDQGIGYRIKLAQREATLTRNIELVTWTFDPLEGRNARFNLNKLGTVGNTYLRNLYGTMRDELNRGLPTDRFRVDWWLNTEHVIRRITGRPEETPAQDYPILNPAESLETGLTAPADRFDPPTTDLCLVEIPVDIQRLKAEAPTLALNWRLQTRQLFEMAFETGYTAIDLIQRNGRNYYLLKKDWYPYENRAD
jgi:predicted GNAT superfamily acetyltransferase